MKVAVLMSTYNGEKYLKEQIDSILKQKGDMEIHLWVRDDGSVDDTITILQKYEAKGQLNWYSGDNLGPAKSFLDLVKHCEGYDYYAFADQDDFWKRGKILAAVQKLGVSDQPMAYFSNAELVDENLQSLGRSVYKKRPKLDFYTLTCAGGILGCTTVFNAKLAELIQDKEMPELVNMHDFYVHELCLAQGGTILYDRRSSMKYRQHGNNVVGVSHGFLGTIQGRIKDIRKKQKIGIADQAQSICNLYENELSADKYRWMKKISCYREKRWNRIRLAFSLRTRYVNYNMGLKIRLSILLGNR